MTGVVAAAFTVRRAERRDLDALVSLEKGFPGDKMSRASLARLLGRDTAEVFVVEADGEVVADAVALFRRGFRTARLYSMIVKPPWRGRGVASALLNAVETSARERGSVSIRLEVRSDNRAAIALYQGAGYELSGSTTDYYEDSTSALRMRKRFAKGGATILSVPYYAQTLEFTCGPASLMMAMRHHGYPVPLERRLELALWREATTVFMLSGHGGCSAHGLAVAALRRGFQATVVTRDSSAPFLDSVRDPDKKDIVRLSHEMFEHEIRALGGRQEIKDFSFDDIVGALKRGAVPLVLVSGYRLHEERMPHWVVVTGFDDANLYLHDPLMPEHGGRADSINLALSRATFEAVSRYGRARHRSMVLVESWGKLKHRRPGDG